MDVTAFAVRNLFFPLMEVVKGNTIRKKLSYLSNFENASFEHLLSLQKDSLQKLLLHCIDTVPFYTPYSNLRELILSDPFLALREFPILSKDVYKENADAFFSEAFSRENLIVNNTGGSTGVPVKFYMDRETVEWYEAARYLGLSRFGIDIGDRCVMLWSNPLDLNKMDNKKFFLKEKILKNRMIIPAFNLHPDKILNYVEFINDYKPVFIYGYTSQVYLFAQLMSSANVKLDISLKAVVVTSESVFDYQREFIESVFDCKLVNEYGAKDAGIIAYEDSIGNLRVNCLTLVLEVLDTITNSIITDTREGEVITTDLHNFAAPRLRYKLGDIVSYNMQQFVINNISGRVNSIFKAIDGRLVHAEFINHLVRNLDSVSGFQFIHHSPYKGTLKLVKSNCFIESDVAALISGIKDKLGDVDIVVEFVDSIDYKPSGKFMYNIREYDL